MALVLVKSWTLAEKMDWWWTPRTQEDPKTHKGTPSEARLDLFNGLVKTSRPLESRCWRVGCDSRYKEVLQRGVDAIVKLE
jgi:hypothetical protein